MHDRQFFYDKKNGKIEDKHGAEVFVRIKMIKREEEDPHYLGIRFFFDTPPKIIEIGDKPFQDLGYDICHFVETYVELFDKNHEIWDEDLFKRQLYELKQFIDNI